MIAYYGRQNSNLRHIGLLELVSLEMMAEDLVEENLFHSQYLLSQE